ncbi:unnamed protein product [Leptosia nina]|uniref:Uncharacterized protein n=1 Tax=Leptosia nina TaxID=320188 RepID=A0AAV1IVM9_9NEOP
MCKQVGEHVRAVQIAREEPGLPPATFRDRADVISAFSRALLPKLSSKRNTLVFDVRSNRSGTGERLLQKRGMLRGARSCESWSRGGRGESRAQLAVRPWSGATAPSRAATLQNSASPRRLSASRSATAVPRMIEPLWAQRTRSPMLNNSYFGLKWKCSAFHA